MKTLMVALSLIVAASGAGRAQEVWRHGIVQPKGDAGFSYMAIDRGFAKKQNIDLQIMPMQGDTLLLKSVIGGALDSYEGGLGSPMIAASKGAPIRLIGCHWQKFRYALFTKANINSVADLKGKTIGVSAPGSQPDLFVRALLRKAGVDPKDAKYALMGSDSQRVTALVNGVIDAAPASDEFEAMVKEQGQKLLVSALDAIPLATHRCIYTTAEKLKSNPQLVARFLAAEMASFRYALDHRDETIKIAVQRAQLPNEADAAFVFDKSASLNIIDKDFSIVPEKLIWMRDNLAAGDFLPAGFDPLSIVDTSALTNARNLLGSGK